MDKLKTIFPSLILIIGAAALLTWLLPRTHADGGLSLPFDNRAVEAQSRAILESLGNDLSSMQADVTLRRFVSVTRQLQTTYGLSRANDLARDSVTESYWRVRWSSLAASTIRFTGNDEDERAARQSISQLRGDLTLHLDPQGHALLFTREVNDSTRIAAGSEEEARRTVEVFVRRWCKEGNRMGDSVLRAPVKVVDRQYRRDHQFTWTGVSPVLHNPVKFTATVAGNRLTDFEAQETIPPADEDPPYRNAVSLGMLILFIIAGIVMLVVAVRRIRSYEIGLRLALAVGIATGILFDLEIFFSQRGPMTWQFLIPLIIAPVFIGGAMVLVWAVAESLAREAWREKLVGFDLISHGYLLHPLLGAQTVRGIAVGLVAGAAWTVLLRVAAMFIPVWAVASESGDLLQFSLPAAWLYVLGKSFASTVYPFAFFVVFGLTAFRLFLRRAPLVLGAATLLMLAGGLSAYSPIPVGIVVSGAAVFGFLWAFYRYDALTSFIAMATWAAVQDTVGLICSGNSAYVGAGYAVLGFFAVLLLVSIAVQYRKEVVTDYETVAPAFARFISERQRLQQELEIARTVQMSFLPKRNPVRYKLDIASRCAPALEVGGDYYDFIELNESKLGVAIGDVSGKGTQAAFFMTLTKGFLRALANVSNSPAAILTQVNKLFYESVDRGMFISMVYGIFDTEAHVLTLSRAGHNPVIVHKSLSKDVQTMNPMGLALGLDAGETFERSIEEVRIPFQPGDVFVFYTDGFPEAMNKAREEFGEGRLGEAVTRFAAGTATEIMEGVFRDMKSFVGGAKQHDDLTIVVVKVA